METLDRAPIPAVSPALLDAFAGNTTRLLSRFALWDDDRSGEISLEEFYRACESLEVPGGVNMEEVQLLFESIDNDASGTIQVQELLRFKSAVLKHLAQHGSRPVRKARAPVMSLWAWTLGAVWKQPLHPHHALDLDPEGVVATVTEHQETPPPRAGFQYTAGPVPDVREFCSETLASLQEGAEDVVVAVGHLLREVRQASLKLEEVKLSQFKQVDAAQHMVHRHELFLQSLGNDLEGALIAIERYTGETDPPDADDDAAKADMRRVKAQIQEASKKQVPAALLARAAGAAARAEAARASAIRASNYSEHEHGAATVIQSYARARHARKECARRRARGKRAARAARQSLGWPPVDRWTSFVPQPGQRYRLRKASRAYAVVLLVYLLMCAGVGYYDETSLEPNRGACEFQQVACSQLPHTYACDPLNGTIALLATIDECDSSQLWWGEPYMNRTCDEDRLDESILWMIPLPLVLFASVQPMLLWRRNLNLEVVYKLAAETPTVWLILLQCTMRAIVLTQVADNSRDRRLTAIAACEAWSLLLQVAIFIFMDAMRWPTPLLRIMFALVLMYRFVSSFYTRSLYVLPNEQEALLPQEGVLRGYGTSTRQSFIVAVDWTVIALMASSIASVVMHPKELAFVTLQCNGRSYSNWRAHFERRVLVRGTRRGEDLADFVHHLQAALRKTGAPGLFTRPRETAARPDGTMGGTESDGWGLPARCRMRARALRAPRSLARSLARSPLRSLLQTAQFTCGAFVSASRRHHRRRQRRVQRRAAPLGAAQDEQRSWRPRACHSRERPTR